MSVNNAFRENCCLKAIIYPPVTKDLLLLETYHIELISVISFGNDYITFFSLEWNLILTISKNVMMNLLLQTRTTDLLE